MSVLIGGVPGAAARLGGGLSSSALTVADVTPMTVLQRTTALNPTTPFPNVGRFRRHISNFTFDLLNNVLGGVTVLLYDWTTKTLYGSTVSDAGGVYDFAIYAEGTTYFMYANKAGSPEVFGGSSNQLVGT